MLTFRVKNVHIYVAGGSWLKKGQIYANVVIECLCGEGQNFYFHLFLVLQLNLFIDRGESKKFLT
jgi:hypothetical protein